jgi:dynein heavy chain
MQEDFGSKLELFGIEPATYKDLDLVDAEIEKLNTVWEIKDGWQNEWDTLSTSVFRGLDTDAMDDLALSYQQRLRKLVGKDKSTQNWPAFLSMKAELDTFRSTLPLIVNLRVEAMRERHFQQIMKEINQSFDPKSESFTLKSVFDLQLNQHADLIARLADDAKKEAKIENGLEEISKVWATMQVDVVEHKNVYFKLRTTEELYQFLEEHILALSAFKSSQFFLPFAAKVEFWERTLANISEVCEGIQAVQKAWMYLENIFVGSEDIRPHLPDESVMFDNINSSFTEMMRKIYQEPLATKACAQPNMLE